MAETTIEWCDYTFNPWEGCTKVHAGCQNCYAEARADRFGTVEWGPHGTRRVTSPANWRKPLKWNREAERDGVRRRVFCASLADVFEDWQGPMVDSRGQKLYRNLRTGEQKPLDYFGIPMPEVLTPWGSLGMTDARAKLYRGLIDQTPWLDWLILTKRPENILRLTPENTLERTAFLWGKPYRGNAAKWRHNVWLLTSVSDQATADRMVPELLKCRDLAPVLGLSCEPLLGAIDLNVEGAISYCPWGECGGIRAGECDHMAGRSRNYLDYLDWVITGCESGPKRRPVPEGAMESLSEQTVAAGVPLFVKQVEVDGKVCHDLKRFPEALRVRQWPTPAPEPAEATDG